MNNQNLPEDREMHSPSETGIQAPDVRLSHSKLLEELNVLHVRRVVAGNPNTPHQVLLRLAADRSVLIRSAVASNPKSTNDMLELMVQDESSEVRLAVAENSNASWEILLAVAKDADPDVRYGMAENPLIPEDILLLLLQDENPYVAWRAMKTMELLSPELRIKIRLELLQKPSSASFES